MIRRKLIPYAFITIMLVLCTLHNALDFSILFGIEQNVDRLIYNIVVAVLFGTLLDICLFMLSKVNISNANAKILYQLISYFLVSVWFIVWTLHMNMSMVIWYELEPTFEFIELLYRHIFWSQFYAIISAVFLKSISIPVHLKDIKNEIR